MLVVFNSYQVFSVKRADDCIAWERNDRSQNKQ